MSGQADERGMIATEWTASIVLLLLPVVMLVATLPTWSAREHAATVIAREAARLAAADWPAVDDTAISVRAAEIATDLGADPNGVAVRVDRDGGPGGHVRVRVTVTMPAIGVPAIGSVGSWSYTATAAARIDDYRSR